MLPQPPGRFGLAQAAGSAAQAVHGVPRRTAMPGRAWSGFGCWGHSSRVTAGIDRAHDSIKAKEEMRELIQGGETGCILKNARMVRADDALRIGFQGGREGSRG